MWDLKVKVNNRETPMTIMIDATWLDKYNQSEQSINDDGASVALCDILQQRGESAIA